MTTPTEHIALRITPALKKKIAECTQRFCRENPGVAYSASDTIRALIERGLASLDKKAA